jgi:hypothetical protein
MNMKFPREVWVGSNFSKSNHLPRRVVHSKKEFDAFVRQHNNRMNCYTSVYDYRQFKTKYDKNGVDISEANISSVILDRIFLDFDSHDSPLEESFYDLRTALRFLCANNLKHNILFSGKGFHVYVYGRITDTIRNIQAFFREVVFHCREARKTGDKAGWSDYEILPTRNGTTLDDAGVRTRQLRRISNTVNMSAEFHEGEGCYYCIPLTLKDVDAGLEHILALAKEPRKIPFETTGDELVEWPSMPPMEDAPIEVAVIERVGDIPIVPCLKQSIMVENPSHEARVYLVQWYRDILAMGKRQIPIEEQGNITDMIMAELESIASIENVWLDWNAETTRFHVEYIVRGGYHAPSCQTLILRGYCPAKCWRY